MLIYRDEEEVADPASSLKSCHRRAAAFALGRPSHDDAVELLIDVGMLEAGVADALCPVEDALPPTLALLRQASLGAGRLVQGSWRDMPASRLREEARLLARTLTEVAALPASVRLKVPEGYAYYALYPETYLEAAARFADELKPQPAVVIGIRSIGTSLSAVVAAALTARGWTVESLTVRPRGHPFDRQLALSAELVELLRARKERWFLIVDEGPGLSGSSFACTAELLVGLGIPPTRILLCPSHLPPAEGFCSEAGRLRWPAHCKLHTSFEEVCLPRASFPAGSRDLAGGAWRSLFDWPERDWPAVHPAHERRKYLAAAADGSPVLHKFAGLGRQGRAALRRVGQLADAGFTPKVRGLTGGFLAADFVHGRPVTVADKGPSLLQAAQAYFRYLGQHMALDEPARAEALLEMIEVNLAKGWPDWRPCMSDRVRRAARGLGEVPAVAVDGRVLPHEWVKTADAVLKTDAVDHYADHFFPGRTDLAWDVAGFGIEFGLSGAELDDLAREVADRSLAGRLSFYRVAYLAFRLGYTSMAVETLGASADGRRMQREADRYLGQIRPAMEELPASAGRRQPAGRG